jgi:hypothetical protein
MLQDREHGQKLDNRMMGKDSQLALEKGEIGL